jgi:hypothetical protein
MLLQTAAICDAACKASEAAQDHAFGVGFLCFLFLVAGLILMGVGFQKVEIYAYDDKFEIARKRGLSLLCRCGGFIMVLFPIVKCALIIIRG